MANRVEPSKSTRVRHVLAIHEAGTFRGIFRGVSAIALLTLGTVLASPIPALAKKPVTGPGTVSLSPGMVGQSESDLVLSFVYTAPSTGLAGGTVKIIVPNPWSAPQVRHSTAPGFVTSDIGGLRAGSRTISVSGVTLCGGCSFTIQLKDETAPSFPETFTFHVSASAGTGRAKSLSVSPILEVIGPPTQTSITGITPGIDSLTVAFNPDPENEYVESYTVDCGTESTTVGSTSSSATVTGLAGDTTYSCTVSATNVAGTGPASSPVNGTTTDQAPGPVGSIGSPASGDGSLTITYTAPSSGGPILNYTATCDNSSTTVDGQTFSITVTGLTNGMAYDCTLTATNVYGPGTPVDFSGIPGPPTSSPDVTSTITEDGSVTLVYSYDTSNSPSITGFTATCGSSTSTVNPITDWTTITGLTDGTAYSCSVTAENDAGPGPASEIVTATPEAVPSVPTSSASGTFNAISCPSPSECVAVGSGGSNGGSGLVEVSTDGGMTFTDEPVPDDAPPLNGVYCSSALDCLAVGLNRVLLTTDGGTSWSEHVDLGNQYSDSAVTLDAVSCQTATQCLTFGVNFGMYETTSAYDYSTDGGDTWETATTNPTMFTPYLYCLPGGNCIGMGPPSLSTDGGETWIPNNPGFGGDWFGLTCIPSSTTCFGTGYGYNDQDQFVGQLITSNDGGQTWSNQSDTLPSGIEALASISCVASATCLALGTSSTGSSLVISTQDGGTTWSLLSGPSSISPSQIACISDTSCVVAGTNAGAPAAATTSDAGDSWTPSTVG